MTNCKVIYNSKKKNFQVIGLAGSTLNVPSSVFPLKGKNALKLFTWENTRECSDDQILSVLSNFRINLGRCYDNADRLAKLFRREGIDPTRIKTYVAWTVFGNAPGYPVHHCITVVDDVHVFDMIPIIPAGVSEEECIKLIANCSERYSIEFYGKGRVQEHICHIAKECSSESALEQRYDLEEKYPNHPAFRTVKNGYTETQRKILEAR